MKKRPTSISYAAYKFFAEMGRLGGKAKSDAKTKACRANAKLPRKKKK